MRNNNGFKDTKTLFAWDLNGTLERGSEIAEAEVINALLSEYGIARRVGPEDVSRAPSAWSAKILTLAPEIPYDRDILDKAISMRREIGWKYSTPAPGALDALETVKFYGDDSIVVSVLKRSCIEEALKKIGLTENIDATYSVIDEFFGKEPKENYGKFRDKIAEYKANLVDGHCRKNSYGRKVVIGDHEKEDVAAGELCGATTFLIGVGHADYIVSEPLDIMEIVYGGRRPIHCPLNRP